MELRVKQKTLPLLYNIIKIALEKNTNISTHPKAPGTDVRLTTSARKVEIGLPVS